MAYDNNMQMILTRVVSDNPNAPDLRVGFEMNGQKFKASLWKWSKKEGGFVCDNNGNPKFKGVIEIDDYVNPNQQQPQQQPQQQQQYQQNQQQPSHNPNPPANNQPPDDGDIPF